MTTLTASTPRAHAPAHLAPAELWFVCGSQHLYGPETLEHVARNAEEIARGLHASDSVPVGVVFKGVMTTSADIRALCLQANADPRCAGLVLWMHTFSPAKMWIGGLSALTKPIAHLHTQHGRDLPWADIDMDFMNLHQAAHGDREAGFLHTRMRLERKVIVGHWTDPEVQARLGVWARAAWAWHDLQGAKIARFGDNMRNVAVTEGDKVAAEMRFGFATNAHAVGDLVERVNLVTNADVDALIQTYLDEYDVAPDLLPGADRHASLRDAARIELGLRAFLDEGGFVGFTDNFEDLHGLKQLPGIATQRLMNDGYGFGGEGDWKTAALVRAMKVMAHGLGGGTSFMEDYTYHLEPGRHQVLGAHMLEICPSIAHGKPRVEVHPLGIGGKDDPVRLVFDARPGAALNASLVDLGGRFRLIVNTVQSVEHPDLPNLPVARAVWEPQPDFKTACAAWIYAGGAHHTGYSDVLTPEHLEDFAAIAGIELVTIDEGTNLRDLRQSLRLSDLYYALAQGLRA
ncbi:L-arabinose isomerase [Deinococcus maricopensis]|uniref:L-arabinose isomerase n=1 Tax=Deinococcus maricopensis (strain DSM 21211 / LMG 22137 / NRRL B-23946 / LB-34) TaxID=709986 RepID=E8U476_DEIML|nr:L-arabinose isomerase [Deinococcus maricopensis]ADV65913.1 L-arabinose isomerase [Deinococcus maricopensis DSM 21211]